MKLTRAEMAAFQKAEGFRNDAKQAIANGGTDAEVANTIQAAADWYGSVAQMIAVRRGKKVSA